MPVNKNPDKRRRPQKPPGPTDDKAARKTGSEKGNAPSFGEETDLDREKDAADAEWKNLWDATEVIDMDKW